MISGKKSDFILECHPNAIRAARVDSLSSPSAILEMTEVEVSGEKSVAEEMRRLAGAKSNGYLQAACAVYPPRRLVRRVKIDAGRNKEQAFLLDYLKKEAKADPEELMAYCLSPKTGEEIDPNGYGRNDIVLCSLPRKDALAIQEDLLGKAVYPESIELGTVAVAGAIQSILRFKKAAQPALALELDENFSLAMIVGQNGVEMIRHLPCGAREFAASLKEQLHLRDEGAAEKLLASRDFDFGPLASKILGRLLRELQSSIGFFEVQTGQSISCIYSYHQQRRLDWLQASAAEQLNLAPLEVDLAAWLGSEGVELADKSLAEKLDFSWLGVLAMACKFQGDRN